MYEQVKKNGYITALENHTWDIFAKNMNKYIMSFKNTTIKIEQPVEEIIVKKENLLELYNLLCSIYYSNYSIQNKLNIMDVLIKKYDIDINLFLHYHMNKISKEKLKTILN